MKIKPEETFVIENTAGDAEMLKVDNTWTEGITKEGLVTIGHENTKTHIKGVTVIDSLVSEKAALVELLSNDKLVLDAVNDIIGKSSNLI